MGIILHNKRGFTLVELLVVVAISGVILSAILTLFTNSQVTYNVQEDVAAMQQNVRTAKMFLERDIRMAGSGVMNLNGPNLATVQPLWFENNVGTTGTDRLTILYDAQQGQDCGPLTAPATSLCSDLPPLTLVASMPKNAASANIEEELSNAPYSNWLGKCSCNGAVYDLSAPSDKMPVLVAAPDKSQGALLILSQITNNSGSGTLDKILNAANVSYNKIADPGNTVLYDFLDIPTSTTLQNKLLNTMPGGSTISFFTPQNLYRATYYVATDANGISVLYRDLNDGNTPEVIAEHIEDLQCAFTLDDGTTINDRDLTAAEIPEVRLVTISILGRSPHPHIQGIGEFEGQREQIEDHPAATTTDNFRRRLLQTTIKIRNFGLN